MSELFVYLIKANIALCLFYLAYRLGLRRLTFYTLNRFFLLSGIVFSSLFPLIDVNDLVRKNETLEQKVILYVPDFQAWQPAVQKAFTVWSFMEWVFWAGVAVMALRLLTQLVSLFHLHKDTHPADLLDRRVRLMGGSLNPFSFFRNIYVNPSLHTSEELKAIVQHESIHVKEWHSADVLMGEINNVFYWFNPGAWLMKTAIKENLEFLTDRAMVRSGADIKAYQYSLVQVTAAQYTAGIANNFNFSHLKNRIRMMNKKRSSRVNIYRYGVLGCIVCGVLLSLNYTKAGTVVHHVVKEVKSVLVPVPVDTITPAPAPAPAPVSRKTAVIVADKAATVNSKEKAITGKASGLRIIYSGTASTGKEETVTVTGDEITQELDKAPVVESPVAGTFTASKMEVRIGGYQCKMCNPDGSNHRPLIIVNGKKLDADVELQSVDPNKIESITILKDAHATHLYGDDGKHGVIVITTKKSAKTEPGKDALEEVTVTGYPVNKGTVAFSQKTTTENLRLEGTITGYPVSKPVAVAGQKLVTGEAKLSVVTVKGYPSKNIGTLNTTTADAKLNEVVVLGYPAAKAGTITGTTSARAVQVSDVKPDEVTITGSGRKTNDKSLNPKSAIAVKVFPNPTGGVFTFTLFLEKAGKGYAEVTDMNGKPIYQKSLTGLAGTINERIDLSNYPAGTYILTVSKDDGSKLTSKIVKSK